MTPDNGTKIVIKTENVTEIEIESGTVNEIVNENGTTTANTITLPTIIISNQWSITLHT